MPPEGINASKTEKPKIKILLIQIHYYLIIIDRWLFGTLWAKIIVL